MGFLAETIQGIGFVPQGIGCLARHRHLWKWAILPTLVNVVVFTAAFALFFLYVYDPLYHWLAAAIRPTPPDTWYAWFWLAPLQIFAWILGACLLLAALALLYVVFLLVGTALAAPFLSILARQVEMTVTGHLSEENTPFWQTLQAVGASLLDEGRKLAFFIGFQCLFLLCGLLPFLSPVMALASTIFTMLFLPLEYMGFAMESRQLRFRERRALVWRYRWYMLGFGLASFVILLVPIVNFLCLSVLVTGGTLLFLHIETLPDVT